ncbi:MAG: hypothetical protein WCD23_03410, partial [Candidatus Acidiferrales bacterium]
MRKMSQTTMNAITTSATTVSQTILIALLAAGLCAPPLPAQQSAAPQAAAPPPPAQQTMPLPSVPPPPPGYEAQQKQRSTGGSVIRSQSNVVRIDVEVTDKSGKPVKGLTAQQFSVFDDGKAQNISTFSYSDIEKMETAGPDDTAPVTVPVDNAGPGTPPSEEVAGQLRDRRLIVLFFDMTSMQTDDLTRAHDAAVKLVT